ncbi:MAG: hypothetical protein M3Q23_07355 [Actinomycetota bacterium]|nr:hypothetical protein [Actinomycetota bacterium]
MSTRWMRSIVLLVNVVGVGACSAAAPSPNIHGVMVFHVSKGGCGSCFSTPVPISGIVDVLGPFDATEVRDHLNVPCCDATETSVVATALVDRQGHFSLALPPGRYVLVGHPPHENRYLDLSQTRVLIVPTHRVMNVRLVLDEYLP